MDTPEPTTDAKPSFPVRILPDSVEGCLDAANIADYAGLAFEAAIHMARLSHIARGLK